MRIMLLLGSSREGRRGITVARWIENRLKTGQEFSEVDFVDARELGLPFFDEVAPPSGLNGNFKHPAGKAWGERVAEADAFIMVTPEYNHGISAVLKNAIDYAWEGWHYKPLSIVSYSNGPIAGARAAEQLRLVAFGVRLLPLPKALLIPFIDTAFNDSGEAQEAKTNEALEGVLAELEMVAKKLKD